MTSLLIETENLKITIDHETLTKFRKFWRENDFTLGIELLDAQHMWLIALLFHLETLIGARGGKDTKQIDAVFAEAMRYAETHFQAEELVLKEYRFPEEENHAAQHHAFKESIRNILNAPGESDTDHAAKLSRFLHNWLIQHIKKEDIAYRDFFRTSGIDANSYFQRLIAGGSEFELTDNQLNLYAEVIQNNEVIPGIPNGVLREIQRMWKSFSIRLYVPLIDMQHLWLIKMIVELEEALKEHYDQRLSLLVDLLPDVKSYVEEHFLAEEAMMDALGYPASVGHKKLHEVFTRTITSHDAEYATRTRQGASVLVHDLKDWLLTHIVIEDAKFAKLCRDKNEEAMKISKQLIAEKKARFKKAQILLYQYVIGRAH